MKIDVHNVGESLRSRKHDVGHRVLVDDERGLLDVDPDVSEKRTNFLALLLPAIELVHGHQLVSGNTMNGQKFTEWKFLPGNFGSKLIKVLLMADHGLLRIVEEQRNGSFTCSFVKQITYAINAKVLNIGLQFVKQCVRNNVTYSQSE
jgi:hypothetical protein